VPHRHAVLPVGPEAIGCWRNIAITSNHTVGRECNHMLTPMTRRHWFLRTLTRNGGNPSVLILEFGSPSVRAVPCEHKVEALALGIVFPGFQSGKTGSTLPEFISISPIRRRLSSS
jgi:hypothetical protein